MTTITPTEPRIAPRSPASALSFGGVLRSEWIKLRRSRARRCGWEYAAPVGQPGWK